MTTAIVTDSTTSLGPEVLERPNVRVVPLTFHFGPDQAYTDKADMSNADLRYANFGDAKLSNVDFHNSDLTGANFGGADCRGADFRNANLTGVLGFQNCR